MKTIYYTASSIDGFIADPDNSLSWLLSRDIDEAGPMSYPSFRETIGAAALGATTYQWILDNDPGGWDFTMPSWVFTHRTFPPGEGLTFTADDVRDVHAAMSEAARDLVMALKGAANRAHAQLFADHRDLFRRPLTTEEVNRFDAILLDPPRAGAREQVIQLAGATVPAIAYVSCNPSSFARDAKILTEGGYKLESVQPVGQFRWSTHVELAAIFRRA